MELWKEFFCHAIVEIRVLSFDKLFIGTRNSLAWPKTDKHLITNKGTLYNISEYDLKCRMPLNV